MPGADIGARADNVLSELPTELSVSSRHAIELHVNVLHALGVSSPSGHVLEVIWVAASREVFRIVQSRRRRIGWYVGCDELFRKSLSQHLTKQSRRARDWSKIGDPKQKSIPSPDVEVWRKVFSVVFDVEIDCDVLRVVRHTEDRSEQSFKSCIVAGKTIGGVWMKRPVISGVECVARRPRNSVVAAGMRSRPTRGQDR